MDSGLLTSGVGQLCNPPKRVFDSVSFKTIMSEQNFARSCLAALFLIAAYFVFDPIEGALYKPAAKSLGLHMVVQGEMGLLPYAMLMMVRVTLDLLVVAVVFAILQRRMSAFPLLGPEITRLTCVGIATGLVVMIGAILTIIATGGAVAVISRQLPELAVLHGAGWLLFDYIGAAGEELYGRVAVLMVAASLLGWRGAAIVSGLMFCLLHLNNPGANWVWLTRLFIQGILLAYAVYRTGSVWWSIGYHAGWNWASAPLFGAAGSGFLDQGHLFDFTPSGPHWLTGGTVGPEGSIFAFIAVFCAFGLLIASTPRQGIDDRPR
jgi:membrane protease YdiL (CAAX protease family)